VDAQRRGLARGQAEILVRQPLLIQAVARLVDDTEESVGEVAWVVARGEPDVAVLSLRAKEVPVVA